MSFQYECCAFDTSDASSSGAMHVDSHGMMAGCSIRSSYLSFNVAYTCSIIYAIDLFLTLGFVSILLLDRCQQLVLEHCADL